MATPILIDKPEITDFVLGYLTDLKHIQDEHKADDEIFYSFLPMNLCIRNKLYLSAVLLHPFVLRKKKFYENSLIAVTNEQFFNTITQIIEYEVLNDAPFLSITERNELIQLHKKMQKKYFKSL